MPLRPPRPCTKPGCRALVRGASRCPAHPYPPRERDPEKAKAYDQERGSARARGYDKDWEDVRRAKLTRDPCCEPCEVEGRTTAATEVDHKVPLRDGGARLDPDNLQSICHGHHARKTARETRERRGRGSRTPP